MYGLFCILLHATISIYNCMYFHILKILPMQIFLSWISTQNIQTSFYIKFSKEINLWCLCFSSCQYLSHLPLFQPAPTAVTPLLLPADRLDGGHRVPQHWHGGPGTGARTTVPHVSLLQWPVSVPVLISSIVCSRLRVSATHASDAGSYCLCVVFIY